MVELEANNGVVIWREAATRRKVGVVAVPSKLRLFQANSGYFRQTQASAGKLRLFQANSSYSRQKNARQII